MSDTVMSSSRGRALKAAAPFIAGALVLGACSKSNPPVNEGAQTGNTTASAPSDTSGGGGSGGGKSTGTTTTAAKSLNVKVYSDGFSYELGGVTYNSSTGELSVE